MTTDTLAGRMVASHTPLYGEILDFYHDEAELLDRRKFDAWLDLLTVDMVYQMPVRSTLSLNDSSGDEFGDVRTGYYDDTKSTLTTRYALARTQGAWGEDPPGRTRRFISNMKLRQVGESRFETKVNLMFTSLREADVLPEMIIGERHDELVRDSGDGSLRISKRVVLVDNGGLSSRSMSLPL